LQSELLGARRAVGARVLGMMALLDFLLGCSIDEVALRYRTSRVRTEDELREVLLDYGFDAKGGDR
jgi:hypothetical protein